MKVEISSNRDLLQMDKIQAMLSKTYWSPGITASEISKGIRNSALVVGAYAEDGGQVGFLRVVSDKVRFAYLADVVVDEACRRQGTGRNMVRFAMSHPEMKDVYQWFLITDDAHGVYEKCGFSPLKNPEKWMGSVRPRPDRAGFAG
jgi:N-acetylglutamate synthase-like GNAT family acetyltransferase